MRAGGGLLGGCWAEAEAALSGDMLCPASDGEHRFERRLLGLV